MGALGLLAASVLIDAQRGRVTRTTLIRSLLGGVFLFILIGTAQKADVLAHAGGFLGGALFGAILALLPTVGCARAGSTVSAPWFTC